MDKLKRLKILEEKQSKLRDEIRLIHQEYEAKREKEMETLVGCCVKSVYYPFAFRKILDFIYNKKYGIHFIFEEIKIIDAGEASIKITSDSPYTNKEWGHIKIPVSGWEEEITINEYEAHKKAVIAEMNSRKKLKKFLTKR